MRIQSRFCRAVSRNDNFRVTFNVAVSCHMTLRFDALNLETGNEPKILKGARTAAGAA
jgi:hypothetical protein